MTERARHGTARHEAGRNTHTLRRRPSFETVTKRRHRGHKVDGTLDQETNKPVLEQSALHRQAALRGTRWLRTKAE